MSQVRAIQLRRGTRAELDSYGPLLIGELGFCTDTGELFIGTPSGNTLVNPATIDWSKVTGKPGTFAPSSHSHAWGDITGKPSSFTPSSHTHTWSQVTSAPATATRWPSWSEVTGKPSTFTPSSHTHSKSDVGLGSVQNYGIATQAQAEAGTSNSVYMTPLRVKQAIEKLGGIQNFPVVAGDKHTLRRQSLLDDIKFHPPTNGTWVKAGEIPIDELIEGTLRFHFVLRLPSGKAGYVEGEIRRNGVSVGEGLRVDLPNNTTSRTQSYTEDIPGWSFGDMIQFYIRGTTNAPYMENMTVKYSFV